MVQSYLQFTATYMLPAFVVVGFLLACYILSVSLRLNYLLFVKHGRLMLVPSSNHGYQGTYTRFSEIVREEGYTLASSDGNYYCWLSCVLWALLALGLSAVVCWLWPIVLLLVCPMVAVFLLASKKRKKKVFLEKLRGWHDA